MSAMRRPPEEGQKPRPLQEKASEQRLVTRQRVGVLRIDARAETAALEQPDETPSHERRDPGYLGVVGTRNHSDACSGYGAEAAWTPAAKIHNRQTLAPRPPRNITTRLAFGAFKRQEPPPP